MTQIDQHDELHEIDDEGEDACHALSPSSSVQVASRQYFLNFDINNTLLHYTFGPVKQNKLQKSETKSALDNEKFFYFVFRVVFQSFSGHP